MSFEKHSNFNKQANFTEVKFGENKPVLEVELNELQQIQNEARADIIRDSIPSGFTQLGEIDYDYCLNNENKIKLKTDSVAYVNGYRINIPKDTIIDIGKAPEKEAREDLLFLEVWKEEVTSDSVLTIEGGEGQTEIPNNIKDSRYPIETTHRVALKWRIRHVADVDFNTFINDGFNSGLYVDWSKINTQIRPQGGNESPVPLTTIKPQDKMFCNCFSDTSLGNIGFMYKWFLQDLGLYISGDGSSTSKNVLKTLDGRVYAIPMFRLYRKPSCGKSIPFEYSKINPKVDYSKFAKLMKEEKVERVANDNVKGRSLVNYIDFKKLPNTYNYDYNTNILTSPAFDNSAWTSHPMSISVSPGKIYSLVINALNDDTKIELGDLTTTLFYVYTGIKTGLYIKQVKIPENVSSIGIKVMDTNERVAKRVQLLFLEGDWTNKEIPEFFTGLKSLGEDDGNLVTVKNEILNDDTYDINDGNQKLNTFSEITHVVSENTIVPKVEAVVKKGEEETPLEKLGTKLETEGNELIEFTKIKGKTIQNLVIPSDIGGSLTTFYFLNKDHESMLKPSTQYTMVVFPSSSKISSVYLKQGVTQTVNLTNNMALFTTIEDISSVTNYIHFYTKGDATLDEVKNTKVMLLEGDWTNTPLEELPYVEGIKSVGEQEGKISIKTCGKNLFQLQGVTQGSNKGIDFKPTDKNTLILNGTNNGAVDIYFQHDPHTILLKKGSTHTVKAFILNGTISQPLILAIKTTNLFGTNVKFIDNADSKGSIVLKNLGEDTLLSGIRIHNPNSPTRTYTNCEIMIQVVEGEEESQIDYIYHKQEIHLKEPLRSLPNGVCDEIVGNKVIRRVGKVVLDGSENYHDWNTPSDTDKTYNVYSALTYADSVESITSHLTCNTLPCNYDYFLNKLGNSIIIVMNRIHISINKNQLSEATINGVKTWLSQNPTTVYYELANPVEEYLENVYEKESIKTYQLDAPLRSLPNGVKDEIKDGVLIRRCGEIVFNGSENWELVTHNDREKTILFNILKNDNMQSSHALFVDKLPCEYVWYLDEEGVWIDSNGRLYASILKSKLNDVTLEGFKTWLSTNSIKLIFPLATPTETILVESKPQTANFTLQRQFGEGNWLRELPNGVKDTIENGKVIRRIGKLALNGSENWMIDQIPSNTKTIRFGLFDFISAINNGVCISDKFVNISNDSDVEHIKIGSPNSPFFVFINTNELSSQDVNGFKAWLSQNPVTVYYELATPTEEALSTDNYMYYPCHEFNTYCGSMYVGEGRNYIEIDNKMPSEDKVVIDTDFREIEGKAKVEDCKYKKCDDGYNTAYISSKTKNLISKSMYTNAWFMPEDPHVNHYDNTGKHYSIYDIIIKPNTTYTLSSDKVLNRYNCKWLDINGDFISYFTLPTGITNGYMTSKLPKSPPNAYYLCLYINSTGVLTSSDYNIQLEEGTEVTPYVDYIPTTKYFENTEENDVEDLRHLVSLTGFNYEKVLNESFDKLLRGDL